MRQFGTVPYKPVVQAMRDFTRKRGDHTDDEIWLLEHEPVYTQGQAGRAEFLIGTDGIPVIETDRGGQVTYHAPGQLTVYLMLDIKRLGLGIRSLVTILEQSVIQTLAHWSIAAQSRPDAPGVYVEGAKIAALGLRVCRGCTYHGLSLNVHMDMEPWVGINACGLGVPVTQMADLLDAEVMPRKNEIATWLRQELSSMLGYAEAQTCNPPDDFQQ